MLADLTAMRHRMLFEYLRQHDMASTTADRLRGQPNPWIEADEADVLRAEALRSWETPPCYDPPEPETTPSGSAAKPSRDYEFFRAVRA